MWYAVVGILLGLLVVYLISRKGNKKPIVKEIVSVKVDTPPVTKDKEVVSKESIVKITKSDLEYLDVDGDEITHVRFKNTQGKVFYDKEKNVEYIAETELPIDFELWVDNTEFVVLVYDVKANDKWSK